MRVRIVLRQRRDVLPRAATQRWNAEELPREDDAVETTAGGGFQGVVEDIYDIWVKNHSDGRSEEKNIQLLG